MKIEKSHQKLIAGGKLLQDEQVVSSLALGTSNIIHLVISEQTKEPKEAPQPEIVPSGPSVSVQEETEPTEEINEENSGNSESRNLENAELENEQTTVNTSGENTAAQTQQSSAESTKEEESWLTPELKRYFDVWDLSIRCYEINGSYDHLVPQLKLYRSKNRRKFQQLNIFRSHFRERKGPGKRTNIEVFHGDHHEANFGRTTATRRIATAEPRAGKCCCWCSRSW